MDPALALEIELVSRHRGTLELIERGDSNIQQFYKDAVIFITGGSGFIGKQLIEKLFRSCKIKKIYMLLRTKKQKTVEQRLEEIVSESVYDVLRESQPHFGDKIEAVVGDIGELRLGLSDEVWNKLTEEVHFIIHLAATINFTEPIHVATLINVRGTREMLTLGKACKKLRSYVHISTAYSYATKSRIGQPVEEQFYPSPMPPTTLIEFAEDVDKNLLDSITPGLIDGWPNTYTFTKAVAEEAVRTMAGDLPICIVRPAIVIAAYHEPTPGWLDMSNIVGPSGVITGMGLGVLHVVNASSRAAPDFVPVDYVNNAIIAASHATVVRRERGETDIKIYTVGRARNKMDLGAVKQNFYEFCNSMTSDKALWYTFVFFVRNTTLYHLLFWMLHYVPAYIIDGVLFLLGKKRIAVKLYDKTYKQSYIFSYFLSNSWKLGDDNLMEMYENMSPTDRAVYQCDTATVNWKQFLSIWGLGIRKYLVKDGLKNTAYALKKQKVLCIVHYFFTTLYVYSMYKILYCTFWVSVWLFQYFTGNKHL